MRVSGTPTYNTRYKELSDESIFREHSGSTYGTLRRWAEILGLAEDAIVLESIEAEEANADELLSEIAERVNYQAAA
jgi:ferritin-like metal-binding protein YciE